MKVLVLQTRSKVAAANFSLSVDVRIAEFMDFLQNEERIQYAVCLVDEPSVTRMLNWAEIVIISKSFSEREIELVKMAKEKGKAVILDIDDYIFAFPKYSNWLSNRHDPSAKITAMRNYVDYVAVENSTLQTEMSHFHENCVVIPNGIYFEKYEKNKCRNTEVSNRYVFTTTDNLKFSSFRKDFIRVITAFHSKYKSMVMDFYGDPIPDIINLPFVRWMPRIYYSDYIASLSFNKYRFAITPLGGEEDSDDMLFHLCKSPIKYINYGFAKIPGIYSDVPIYRRAIEDKKSGLLVKNTFDSWFNTMCEITEDDSLRESICINAYQDIRDRYYIKESAYKYYNILQTTLNRNSMTYQRRVRSW